VKGCENDLGRGALLGGMEIDGNTATFIDDGDAAVLVNCDGDFAAMTADSFVDRVIHDFVDEVMQSIRTSGPNVHCRTFSDWIEAF
jgi:hypothetical protein